MALLNKLINICPRRRGSPNEKIGNILINRKNTFTISNTNEVNYFVVIVKDESGNKALYQSVKIESFTRMTEVHYYPVLAVDH
jgi:hypothetical protein